MHLDEVLEVVYKLQRKYPTLHVGGSIGLYLHGIDLGRRHFTDIDFCISEDKFGGSIEPQYSSGNDFHYKKTIKEIDYEIRIDDTQTFDVIVFNGRNYNVSKLNTIVKYKQLYASRGYQKHTYDLKVIYKIIGKPAMDDLPF